MRNSAFLFICVILLLLGFWLGEISPGKYKCMECGCVIRGDISRIDRIRCPNGHWGKIKREQ